MIEDWELDDQEQEDVDTLEDLSAPVDSPYPDWEPDDQEQEEIDTLEVQDRSAPVDSPYPGCAVSFFLDNKRHHALCLAVLGDELLLEHKGPTRCTLFTGKVVEMIPRLRAGVASATFIVGKLKPWQYRKVPKKWIWEMVKTGHSWKGIERGGGLAPSPSELLNDNYQMELF